MQILNKVVIFISLILSIALNAQTQVKGQITDNLNKPLPFVNIYLENTYIGTTTNETGKYELQIPEGTHILVIQYIGFKTQKINIKSQNTPLTVNATLEEENFNLKEVVISAEENPALPIIRKAIEFKKVNQAKADKFTADFYSKGKFKLKNVPKKFMGQEIGDLEGSLDSTRSGIIYLSETVSKITFEKPDQLKERIIASKVSGEDNGFSYNTAMSTRYEFYNNTLNFGTPMISPIADNAFGYYKYKLEGTFYDEHNHLINKIQVIPKRDVEPVFEGFIYIIEDTWEIYAVDLDIKGYRSKNEFLNNMTLKQQYSFNKTNQLWAKNTQSLQIEAGIFGVIFEGNFSYVFSNYEFVKDFDKKTFGREIVSFEDQANKKDTLYWNQFRPVPLTEEERTDYVKKDSISVVRNSKVYLDSTDRVNNKFKIKNFISGYTYANSFKKWRLGYNGMIQMPRFNTVQGWNLRTGLFFQKRNEDNNQYQRFNMNLEYGFADERLRPTFSYTLRVDPKSNSYLVISGGNQLAQFNNQQPISYFSNSWSSLFFKNNYMKLYEKNYLSARYNKEVINGINMYFGLEYADRNSVFNQTDYVLIAQNKLYTSNNPLDSDDFENGAIDRHQLVKFNLTTQINFGQKYIARPDGKINLRNSKYPTLVFGYEKGMLSQEKNYEYDLFTGRVSYSKTVGNKGDFGINIKGGKFFNAHGIAFVDYKHFNGNQTHVTSASRNLNAFNLLPYYSHSTNKEYYEMHFEHNFNGYVMNKIPVLNLLKSNLVVSFRQLAVPEFKPYHEMSVGLDRLGFGKFKNFRIDYVKGFNGSTAATEGFMFGAKFLGIFD